MSLDTLMALCNADAIASKEEEVRCILRKQWKEYCDDIVYDPIGSMIAVKKGNGEQPLRIMFCAHMDEVGFEVRHISDIGFVYVIAIGGVIDRSKHMQIVRITTYDGRKHKGILNVVMDGTTMKDMYVDLGCETRNDVEQLGIDIGDMVCFASESFTMSQEGVIAGKAMDDRCGCYVLTEALKQLSSQQLDNDIYMVATSSEEVGVRGGKLATHAIQPDIVFAIDVANHPELDRGFQNHRKIGKGFMLVHYDKTLAPNEHLLHYIKQLAKKHELAFQCDMFSGGGSDAGNAHLEDGGRLAMVIGIPLRYCHSSWSLVHEYDLNGAISLIVEIAKGLHRKDKDTFVNFNGGKDI